MATGNAAERMLAAQQEIIDRLRKSVEVHNLNDGELVAAAVFAMAEALIELTGVSRRTAGETLERAVRGLPRLCGCIVDVIVDLFR